MLLVVGQNEPLSLASFRKISSNYCYNSSAYSLSQSKIIGINNSPLTRTPTLTAQCPQRIFYRFPLAFTCVFRAFNYKLEVEERRSFAPCFTLTTGTGAGMWDCAWIFGEAPYDTSFLQTPTHSHSPSKCLSAQVRPAFKSPRSASLPNSDDIVLK